MTDGSGRTVGERLRLERDARGLTQADMARELHRAARETYPPLPSLVRQIRGWESGDHLPKPHWRRAYALALQTSEADLFTPVRTLEGVTLRAVDVGPDLVVKAGDIEVIREMLRSLTAVDRQFGGGYAREQAAGFLRDVVQPRLSGQASIQVHRELCAIATEFTLRVSAMTLDAGSGRLSRSFLGAAVGTASEADDPTLMGWVLARRGEQEIDERHTAVDGGNAVDRALSYSAAAAAMTERASPMARAFILTKRALALSCTGDKGDTRKVLGEMWTAYNSAGQADEPDWMSSYGWAHLRHEEARCLANLGLGKAAAVASAESLKVRTSAKPRAFSVAVQALAHVHTSDVDKAAHSMLELTNAVAALDSWRVRAQLSEVARVLKPYQDVTAVQDAFEAARPLLERS